MDRIEKADELFDQLYDKHTQVHDQDYHEMMKNHIYGSVYQHGSLDLKLRELILIVVQTTNHTLKPLKEHVFAGIKAGLKAEEILEAVYQCTPYVGYGKVCEALDAVNEVFEEKHIVVSDEERATVTEKTRFEDGLAIQVATFGERIRENYENAPRELKHIQNYLSEHCFGDFYTRKGLNMKTRELLTFVMIATLGGCENQLRGHTAGNLAVGNDRETLIETITQCQPYIGFPRTLNAINIINEVTNK